MKKSLIRIGTCTLALVAVFAVPISLSAQVSVGTNDGSTNYGDNGGHTLGQLITAPTDASVLKQFSFWIARGSPDILFHAYVMGWDATSTRPTGSILYESPAVAGTGSSFFTQFTFEPGHLQLSPNQVYALFLSPLRYARTNALGPYGEVAFKASESYAGGQAVVFENGGYNTDLALELQRSEWVVAPGGRDLTFEAQFGADVAHVTPEPMSIVLLGSGLGALAGFARKRRKGRDAARNSDT
jgi:hypothetical protein